VKGHRPLIRYVLRRLAWMVALLFFVSAITFVIFYLFPTADPAQLRAGRQPNPELVEKIRDQLGLDEPWYEQFWIYIKDLVLHFDLGRSYQSNVPVRDQIFDRLPATASLVLGAAVLWITAGIAVGTISAIKRGSVLDRTLMTMSLVAVSAPPYWLGLVVLYLFANDIGQLHWFEGSGTYVPLTEDPWQWAASLVLPWIVLAASFAAIYARLVRATLAEAMDEDYVRTARAKGLRESRVVVRHGLRSAITPVVTAAGLDIGLLLSGAILVETVFNVPGIGALAFEAILDADLPMIQGTVLLGAFFIVVANLVVDVAYRVIDPRVGFS
jgi:peptide/nickel transport system permease protein